MAWVRFGSAGRDEDRLNMPVRGTWTLLCGDSVWQRGRTVPGPRRMASASFFTCSRSCLSEFRVRRVADSFVSSLRIGPASRSYSRTAFSNISPVMPSSKKLAILAHRF